MAATDVLTFNMVEHLLPGQRDLIDTFMAHDTAISTNAGGGLETLTGLTGSIIADITKRTSLLAFSGTVAFTLPDGTYAGQEHQFLCTSAASTPLGTLTVTTPESATGIVCASTFVFDTAGQGIVFVWSGTKWRCARKSRAGVKVPVIGTTVLTGHSLVLNYSTSVTGTVDSTTTKGLPDGSAAGEACYVSCSVAASTPIGSLDGTYVTLANAAATHLQAIGATTDTVTLQWTGSAWLVAANSGITVA